MTHQQTRFKTAFSKILPISMFLGLSSTLWSCKSRSLLESTPLSKPKSPDLVILVIVDQMRFDTLQRFQKGMELVAPDLKERGLLKFLKRGVSFTEATTAGAPTVTAAGHASICTGAAPYRHGIVANALRLDGKILESAKDEKVSSVLSSTLLGSDALSQAPLPSSSPWLLMVPSFSEVFVEKTKGRAISLSLKDRGSVYCGTPTSLGAFWYDYRTGGMATSTAFMPKLPSWVEKFNSTLPDKKTMVWKPLLEVNNLCSGVACLNFASDLMSNPIDKLGMKYKSELALKSLRIGSAFPYPLEKGGSKLEAHRRFEYSPFANDFLADFALAAIQENRLGKHGTPDLVSVSFSTPDLIGHEFGPNSFELFDIYLQLHKTMARFQDSLEKQGLNALWVLSADHGVQNLPELTAQSTGGNQGRIGNQVLKDQLNTALNSSFSTKDFPHLESEKVVADVSTDQIYLNKKIPFSATKWEQIHQKIISQLNAHPGIERSFSKSEVQSVSLEDTTGLTPIQDQMLALRRGFDEERSGDLFFVVKEGWLGENAAAGNHGSIHPNDRKIPIVFVDDTHSLPQTQVAGTAMADDIAPTILDILGKQVPKHMTGKSLKEHLPK